MCWTHSFNHYSTFGGLSLCAYVVKAIPWYTHTRNHVSIGTYIAVYSCGAMFQCIYVCQRAYLRQQFPIRNPWITTAVASFLENIYDWGHSYKNRYLLLNIVLKRYPRYSVLIVMLGVIVVHFLKLTHIV